MSVNKYDTDFYAWASENAELLKQKKFSDIDVENIAEEIEALGKRDKRELRSRMTLLLMHLLKWEFQPGLRSSSWEQAIKVQRKSIAKIIEDSGSLKKLAIHELDDLYEDAIEEVVDETGLESSIFPRACDYDFSKVLDSKFWPGEPR